MARLSDMLVYLRKRAGYSQDELSEKIKISRSSIGMYETGKRIPPLETLEIFADFYNVDMNTLTGGIDSVAPNVTSNVVTFHPIGSIAAGYDHIAFEDDSIGDAIDIPISYLHGRPKSDYFMLVVTGDSMYPLYHDGDHVLVLRQSALDCSGEIGVVLYDSEDATLKRVEYPDTRSWMRLVPVNPNFPPKTISGEDLDHCRILGVPKVLIRTI